MNEIAFAAYDNGVRTTNSSESSSPLSLLILSNSTEIYIPVVNAVLRRFGIKAEEFWD